MKAKAKKREPKPPYEISYSMTIKEEHGYTTENIEHYHTTDRVPEGTNPVEYLRTSINREFKRKFADLDLPWEEEDTPIERSSSDAL